MNIQPTREVVEESVRSILAYIGEDPTRDGLQDTPRRVIKAYDEILSGYKMDPKDALSTVFDNGDDDAPNAVRYNGMVMLKDIDFYSMCEHHMLPFFGQVHIGYIPRRKILGLSKFARITEMFARRLQIQERLATQIADAIVEVVEPMGVGVVIEGTHLCMMMRGVEKQQSTTVTSAMRGIFRKDLRTREEFLALLR